MGGYSRTMDSRWDRLLDLRTTTLVDALMTEAAKVMAEDLLTQWPPPVEGIDVDTGAEFAPLFAPDAPRPPAAAFSEAVRLARWDLQHEIDAYDDYMKHDRFVAHALDASHRTALLFLSRWMVEQLLSLGEATDGRVRRKDMVAALDRLAKLLTPS